MPTTEERIADLEERLRQTKPNKHTMKSIVTIKADIARLRRELVKQLSSKGGGGSGFSVKRTGDAQVALIGFPSVGKSTLLNQLTSGSTNSKVAAYDFTTLDCVPGMLIHKNIAIQLLDLPGIILGASQGRGRGREILSVLRSVDLIVIVVDVSPDGEINMDRFTVIQQELYNIGIRINKEPPRIHIKRTPKGGIGITHAVKLTRIEPEHVKIICEEYKISNAHITFYENSTADDLIDALLGNCEYIPAFVAVNKIDLAPPALVAKLPSLFKGTSHVTVSGNKSLNIDALKDEIYEKLGLARVYMKPKNQERVDLEHPLVIKKGATIQDVCKKVHKDFVRNFKFAKVWGVSAKHPGQVVHLSHVIADGDVVTIFLKA